MKKPIAKLLFLLCVITTVILPGCKPLGPLKVACVGDSNTASAGIFNKEENSYPAKLQKMAGDDWLVMNYGTSGSSVMKSATYPYTPYSDTLSYRQTLEFEPDIIILALGWNDLAARNPEGMSENFVNDYNEIIDSFNRLSSRPRIILVLMPTSATSRNTLGYSYYLAFMKRVAKENNLPLLDLFPNMSKQTELFQGDKIHLTIDGYEKLAEEIYKAIPELIK